MTGLIVPDPGISTIRTTSDLSHNVSLFSDEFNILLDEGDVVSYVEPAYPRARRYIQATQADVPLVNAVRAHNSGKPTQAQQLYASVIQKQPLLINSTNPLPENGCDDGGPVNSECSGEDFDPESLYASPSASPSATPSSPTPTPTPLSSVPSPSLNGIQSFSNRAGNRRGARSSTVSRLSTSPLYAPSGGHAATFKYTLPHLSSSSNVRNPGAELTFQHHGSATLPTAFPRSSATNTLPSGSTTARKEAPMYTTTARLSSQLSDPSKLTTPAFQNGSLSLTSRPNPIVVHNIAAPKSSAIDSLPSSQPQFAPSLSGATIQHPYNLPWPAVISISSNNATISSQPNVLLEGAQGNTNPTATLPQNDVDPHARRKILKKISISIGKSVGKVVLKARAKMVLGSVGIPTDVTNILSSEDEGGVVDALTAGLSEMVASAASGVSNAIIPGATQSKPSTPSTANTASPSASVSRVLVPIHEPAPAAPAMPSMPTNSTNVSQADYDAIVHQMNLLHVAQQKQAMALQELHHPPPISALPNTQAPGMMNYSAMGNHINPPNKAPVSVPILAYSAAQIHPEAVLASHSAQTFARPQDLSQNPPSSQSNILGSVLGGATNAVVSSAIANIDFAGLTDAASSTLTDFTTSFYPTV
ncbi:unnamed protein product [Cyclocybe aegerita]|uniref:Uncharacterized protein n=1 Tax=Cyclocybe aegerita TaxID=1973307 RepID=A0A8S0W5L6_CYCAE|nr:unnamed protein product [Cyclocybe aegerita]